MTRNLKFLETDNDSFLMYYKANPDESDIIIVLVNLDPYHCQTGQVILPLDDLGVRNQPFLLLDLLTDEHFLLQSGRYTLSLDPAIGPAFIFRLVRRKHMEVDYEYY